MAALSIGIKPPSQLTSIDVLQTIWPLVDDAGFDGCWVFDHFAPMGQVRDGDIFEAWSLLAAMAQATCRVRIGCLVTGNTNRHPAVLAKIAATVDQLSAGRLDFGIGAGGDALADSMYGLPQYGAGERLERLSEALHLIALMWREPSITFAGKHYRLTEAQADPKPVQRPRPPIWIGSSGERRGLRIVAEHADVWVNACLPGTELAEISRLSGLLDDHCRAIERDPSSIRRAAQFAFTTDRDQLLRTTQEYAEAGFTELILMIRGVGSDALRDAEAAAGMFTDLRDVG